MQRLCILLLILKLSTAEDRCSLCLKIVTSSKKEGSESEQQTKERALKAASSLSSTDRSVYTNELNCHWIKYYGDANMAKPPSSHSICADTGMCPLQYQNPTSFNIVDITNTTKNYGITCTMPKIILVHHTATKSFDDTLSALNSRGLSVQYIVSKKGTVYQQVRDFYRAWHAGAGVWREVTDVNSYSVGIEIVNTGDEPYPQEQINAVSSLVVMLKHRWHVHPNYIIAHADITPENKDDPSGYFPWSTLYEKVSIYPGLFNTSMTHSRQHGVIIGKNVTYTAARLEQIQNDLMELGYKSLILRSGVYDTNTAMVFQAFNRHFAPEIFVKEKIGSNDETQYYESNQYWYGISQERLQKLMS
ncbi:unnamed protein product [Cylicocyclus nassatus]|uniref:N-acetylmuramoyl-L-alanine amidase n=1 Tax=Cylicocyclus nassatus TaxID=53992 RepID=A0AA36HBJ5_CYLNA|nr:unnamed protein product [Cylicocyclus nassatus]